MGIFEEGRLDCVKELLKPAERVLKEGLDIVTRSFSARERLWIQVEENYNRYLDGECGEFLRDLDMHLRGKFEGALAILAWSFWKNGELYPPANERYMDRELEALERVLRYNVFEIYSREDVMKRIMHRDTNVLELLRGYYHGVDRWIDDVLNDPSIKLPLRRFLKGKWDSYKSKVNEAIAEATVRFDWLRDFLMVAKEETEAVEKMYRKRLEAREREVGELRERMNEMLRSFEREKEELRKRLETVKEEEISRLIREKEELKRQFEEERQRLIEEISKMKDEEAKRKLEAELERVQREMMGSIRNMEEEIKRKELELREKEMELRKRELELKEKEDVIARRIREVMELTGKVEKGSRFVKIDEARILEMNFVGRIRSKLRGEVKLNDRTFRVESIEEKKTFDKSRYEGKMKDRDLKNVPDNRLVEILLREKKLFGRKEKIRVKALFHGRPERYAEVGFDTDPLELADINALLVEARDEAKKGRVILLVASPTGFERRIENYVNSSDFHRNFISENVSLVLLDLESGKLIYNPHDKYAKAFEPMLRLELDRELLAKVKGFIEEKIAKKGYIRLDEALEYFDEGLVKRTFHELSREKGYVTKFVEGVGYLLIKGGFL